MRLQEQFIKELFIAVLAGLPVTLKLVGVVLIVSLMFGFLVALGMKNNNSILAKLLSVYISIARGVPTMVQVYLIYTAMPTVLGRIFQENNIDIDVYAIQGETYAYIIFSFGMTAIMAEMFRGALSAIDKGQLEAAKSIGLTAFQGYRRIVIPQAIVHILPVLCTNVTGLVKMSSLAFALSVFDITAIAKTEGARNTCYVEAYLVIAVLYVVINLTVELIFKLIEKRVEIYHPL